MSTASRGAAAAMLAALSLSAFQDPGGVASIQSVCVAKFSGDEKLADSVREIAIAGVFGAKRFRVTENCDRAGARLHGAVLERAEKKVRAEGESTGFGAVGAAVSGQHGALSAAGADSGESLMSAETTARASVSLRLTNMDGDVVWAYTQDSSGGKTKGAVADAVERAVRQLVKDFDRAKAR